METPEQTEARQMAAVEHFFGPGQKYQAMLMVRAVTASNRSAGMVLVPREPTPKMLQAAIERPAAFGVTAPTMYTGIWHAMIAEGADHG